MDNKQKYLKRNIDLIEKSIETLQLSLNKCKKIGVKNNYSFEELESYDSLTSKFARTSDIYTQKVLRSVFEILRERQMTFIDMANKAEKLSLITLADDLIEIRDIRNEIAHEYIEEVLYELFEKILNKTETLISFIKITINYIKINKLLNE